MEPHGGRRAAGQVACAMCVLACMVACTHLAPAGPSNVRITVGRSEAGPDLPPDFIGLSYEKAFLNLPLFDRGDAAMVNLFRRLGPGVLRVGGNSVDRTSWDPSGPGLRKGFVAPADISRLARFLAAADWRIIYGLNMATSTPEAMADEASAAEAAFGDRLVAFEIGNEPDLYHANKLRSPDYAYTDYLKEWNTDARAISMRVPGADFAGPATAADASRYTVPFARDTRGKVALLTHHYYRANGRSPSSTVELLLSPDLRLSGLLRTLAEASVSQDILGGFRLGEANSFYNGGAPHVSDSFASALWAIDFLFTCAASGASGVNFHGGGRGPGYTPIADDGENVREVRPEYYGTLLFSLAAQGRLTKVEVSGGNPSPSAWAVSGRDGSIRIVIQDRDAAGEVPIDLEVPKAFSTASLLRLTGPSLGAETGTLLGGSPVSLDGSWEKRGEEQVIVRNGSLPVRIAGPGALLVVVRQ